MVDTTIQEDKKVFLLIGATLPRTGTMSLQRAFEVLLPGKCQNFHSAACYHGNEWTNILNGSMDDAAFKEFLLSNGFVASVDAPFCFFYERAMRIFPNAKVILTVRDPARWVKSVQSTIIPYFKFFNTFIFPYSIFRNLSLFTSYLHHPSIMFINAFLTKSKGFMALRKAVTENRGEEYFQGWITEVKANVPKEKLLVYRVEEGWAPLCEFLDVGVPDVPFPNINNTAAFLDDFVEKRKRRSWLLLYELVSVPALMYLCYKLSRK